MDVCRAKKAIKIIACLALCAFVLIHIVPIPVNKVYDAKQIKLDAPTYIKDCQISISGNYYFNLFTEDVFRGQIEVSDNPETKYSMTALKIQSDGDVIEYTHKNGVDEENNPIKMHYFLGRLFSKPLMRNLCIIAFYEDYDEYGEARPGGYGGAWNDVDGFCIVPSNSREEAIDVLRGYGLVQP